jgi:hypothetical protein
MIRPTQDREFYIDLDCVQGNANNLLATAMNLANQVGLDGDKIIVEMKSGDYINLVKIFDKYFGKYVILETTNEELLNAS